MCVCVCVRVCACLHVRVYCHTMFQSLCMYDIIHGWSTSTGSPGEQQKDLDGRLEWSSGHPGQLSLKQVSPRFIWLPGKVYEWLWTPWACTQLDRQVLLKNREELSAVCGCSPALALSRWTASHPWWNDESRSYRDPSADVHGQQVQKRQDVIVNTSAVWNTMHECIIPYINSGRWFQPNTCTVFCLYWLPLAGARQAIMGHISPVPLHCFVDW